MPYFDPDYLKKLEATVKKASAYLDKANASSWWNSWIMCAQEITVTSEPQNLHGNGNLGPCPTCMAMLASLYSNAGDWILNTLKVSFPKAIQQVQQHATEGLGDDISGIELESPHKSIAVAQDFPCNIEGIGDLRTSWIGQNGVKEIQQNKLQAEMQTAVKAKATEVKVLAAQCLRAFEEAKLEDSVLPQVQKAISMCLSYAPCKETPSTLRKSTSIIATLWNKEKLGTSVDATENAVASQAVATAVLGEKLVATVMQEKQRPPDVSFCNVCVQENFLHFTSQYLYIVW